MAGITLAQAETRLQEYLDAESSVLSGQSYEIAGRRMTRADLAAIQQGIDLWNKRVQALASASSGRGRAVIVRPS